MSNEQLTAEQRLHEAAKTLRDRAEKASPGPWRVDDDTYPEAIYSGDVSVVAGGRWGGEASVFDSNDDGVYIATMHPGVELALADMMDEAAKDYLVERGYASQHLVKAADLILGGAS